MPKPMIRKLTIQNYKSVSSAELELEPFNCLVGSNNSGKSNILDAFSFLSDTAERGLGEAVRKHGGMDKILHYGAKSKLDSIALKVSMDAPPSLDAKEIRYSLRFDEQNYPVMEETIEGYISAKDSPSLRLKLSRKGRGKHEIELTMGSGNSSKTTVAGLEEGYVSFLNHPESPHVGDFQPVLSYVNEYFRNMKHYKFVPDQLKSGGQAVYSEELEMDGRNFASYLHQIQSGFRKVFNRIEDQLTNNFPEIEELITPLKKETSGLTEVGIKEVWFEKHASGEQLSDGLIGFLAALVVLFGPEKATVAIFEEPENYIHPKLLERLVKMLKNVSSETQILISTHSVSLLNYLDLEDMVVVEREEGASKASRVSDKDALKKSLKDWALGDAYAFGLFEDAD